MALSMLSALPVSTSIYDISLSSTWWSSMQLLAMYINQLSLPYTYLLIIGLPNCAVDVVVGESGMSTRILECHTWLWLLLDTYLSCQGSILTDGLRASSSCTHWKGQMTKAAIPVLPLWEWIFCLLSSISTLKWLLTPVGFEAYRSF